MAPPQNGGAVRVLRSVAVVLQPPLKVKPVSEASGGRYLVRGGAHKVHEGNWNPTRLVVFEFPSEEAMQAFYESPEYRGLKAMRESCSRANLVSVEGV